LTCECGLPPGWDELEAFAKKRAGEVLSRGTVYANLNVKRANAVADHPYQRGGARLDRKGSLACSPAR